MLRCCVTRAVCCAVGRGAQPPAVRGGVTRALENGRARVEMAGGAILPALAVKAAVGEPTQISIRPERVSLDPSNTEIDVEGTIAEVIYLGDHIRIRMRVFDDDNFIVKLSNGAGRRAFAAGETLRVGWSVEDGRALDV